MTIPYSPLAIANEFIALGKEQGGVEHMKLQKLVYYAYGWWLAAAGHSQGKPLTTEGPQIWKYGPVFAGLYGTLKDFGRIPIDEPQSASPFSEPDTIGNDEEIKQLIKWIWKKYGHWDSLTLSAMTHKPGTSWERTARENNYSVPFNMKIPDQYILEEFTKMLEETHA